MDSYKIIYTNLIHFNGVKLAFRKKELFNISSIPIHINKSVQGWWIGGKLLTLGKIKEIVSEQETVMDISELQWNRQLELDCVFNI